VRDIYIYSKSTPIWLDVNFLWIFKKVYLSKIKDKVTDLLDILRSLGVCMFISDNPS